MTLTADAVYPVTATDDHPAAVAGTLDALKTILHAELASSGYSLTAPEVLTSLKKAVRFYAAHATLETQRRQAEGSTTAIPIDGSLTLDLYEWAIIQPLARAYCDLQQAYRMEAAGSLGMERYGMQVSEALQNAEQIEMAIPKSAFIEAPFSIELE